MIFWLSETICHFKKQTHILSGTTHAALQHGQLSVMGLSVTRLLCYKICSFRQFVFCKPNNLWRLYGSDNQLSDRQPFPPKSIIQIQSSDQNQSNDQRSLQPDGWVVTGMKWVCGFTQGIKSTVLFFLKKEKENIFTVDTIFCADRF